MRFRLAIGFCRGVLRRTRLAAPLLLAGFLTALVAQAQSPGGTIEGRVFNAATGAALSKARVAIEGTHREVVTDESGSLLPATLPSRNSSPMIKSSSTHTATSG